MTQMPHPEEERAQELAELCGPAMWRPLWLPFLMAFGGDLNVATIDGVGAGERDGRLHHVGAENSIASLTAILDQGFQPRGQLNWGMP